MPPISPPHRPPWWPQNEPWPPQHDRWGRVGRGRFFLRLGMLLAVLAVFGFGACFLVSWLAGMLFAMLPGGPMDGPHMGAPEAAQQLGRWEWGWVALAGGGLGIWLTLRALRRTTEPIGDLMDAANRVEDGDYSARVNERGPREVRNLARAFNAMTERLERNDAQRRALLADVTHELRTPLTVMQGNLEAMLDGVYPRDEEHLAPILEETRVLGRLVEDLRTLALAESGALKLYKEPTDLEILITETLASFRAQSHAAGLQLTPALASELPVMDIDPLRIREVLANLLANALRHTPPGGSIVVAAALDGGMVRVSVADTGSGIAPEALPHIFDRFYKSEHSRGMGLGLAIARNLVAAHGGEIAALSPPGGGATVRFSLPVDSA